jgi:hypothetical protein
MNGQAVVWLALSPIVGLLVLGSGCQSPALGVGAYTRMQRGALSQAEAFRAAEQALGERFQIETRDPDRGVLESAATVSRTQKVGRLGDAVGYDRPVRKIARVVVEPYDGGVSIWCRVVIEENEATGHRMYAQERGGSDLPSDAPADRDAAVTAQQDAVWRYAGRDQQMEREIRQAISEILSKSAT